MSNDILIHTRESIILTSIDVIDELGIQGFSTREVARRVGISEPAIFKHFKTKSDLLLAVLDHFSYYDEDVIQSIKTKGVTPVEAIISFVDIFGTYYDNYPAITAITLNYDVLLSNPKLSQKVKGIIKKRNDFIIEMIDEAQKVGEIRNEVKSEYVGVAIMGAAREWCLNWRIAGRNFSLREKMVGTLRMTLNLLGTKC